MKTVFTWNRNSLSKVDTLGRIPRLMDKDMVGESLSKMKNRKAAGPSGVLPEMVKAAGEAEVDMITDLINRIIIGVIPAEWELCTLNCHKRKGNYLERRNYRGLK